MFVQLRVCCENLQMIIWLDVNASFVSSCHARAARHTLAVTWRSKLWLVTQHRRIGYRRTCKFVRSRVCCQKWHLTIRLDANAVHVSSCRARAARHVRAVTSNLKFWWCTKLRQTGYRRTPKCLCDCASAARICIVGHLNVRAIARLLPAVAIDNQARRKRRARQQLSRARGTSCVGCHMYFEILVVYKAKANQVSWDTQMIERLCVCCQNLQLTIGLEANASYVSSCHARAARHMWAVTWRLTWGWVTKHRQTGYRQTSKRSCDRASAAKSGI